MSGFRRFCRSDVISSSSCDCPPAASRSIGFHSSPSLAWARRTRARSSAVAASAACVAVTRSVEGSTRTVVGKSRMKLMLNSEQLLTAIRDKMEHPATARELLQRLKIPREQRATVNRLLQELVEAGHLVHTRGNHFGLPDRMNLVGERVQTNPRSFGVVIARK